MRKVLTFLWISCVFFTQAAWADGKSFLFDMMDGTTKSLADLGPGPILVTNTASRCAYTRQYDDLQALYDLYRDAGLTVVAVPAANFRQELATNDQVKDFCAINFDLDLPMTMMTSVRGADAHPFYAWMRETTGFVPRWNFNKVLLSPSGAVLGTWGAPVSPTSPRITNLIEDSLSTG